MSVDVHVATKDELKRVIQLMLSGVSSDPDGMDELKSSWWRHLMFRYVFGPRLLSNQMDTLVATRGEELLGYLVVQYMGDVAGTFDWAVMSGDDKARADTLDALVQAATNSVADHEGYTTLFFGLRADAPPWVTNYLAGNQWKLLDYQLVQLVSDLPLSERLPVPAGLDVSAKIPTRFSDEARTLIPLDYPSDAPEPQTAFDPVSDLDIIIAVHEPTLARNSKILLVEEDGEAVGFVQQTRWRDELRLLLALHPDLWNTPEERQLVSALPSLLGRNAKRVRVRSFSQAHLSASRPTLETLGLSWEPAPWRRWAKPLIESADRQGVDT
jgi:hypothetical protein